ncbi:hypothetical protein GCM10012286_04170 [Streptomyces lasiicapitis]|uniref:Uncharacterized protein n=1 Tax=Streptomyces lasiicapitis TaxID=1923961 RepID=A0ABQ2LI30_9ACTN|nr:hypothetical protein GCM10012286_04170 [Streptomyces lasiicapitis]
MTEGLGRAIAAGDGDEWLDWLDGDMAIPAGEAEGAADELAAENDSNVTGFMPDEVNGYPGYWVEATTNYTVGDSIIPGTETMHAKARATAVIKPRCGLGESADPEKVVEFICDGDDESTEIDPDDFDPEDLPDASDLFAVHLAK